VEVRISRIWKPRAKAREVPREWLSFQQSDGRRLQGRRDICVPREAFESFPSQINFAEGLQLHPRQA